MYKFGHLLLLIFFVAFVSCEKAENDANGTDNSLIGENYKLADGVVLVDDAIAEQFVSVESGRIIMSSSANNVPTVNSILLAPITSITPNGMLVRIISVEKTPIGYVLVTEPAALQDAFEELHISGSFDISEFVDKVTDNDGNLVTADLVSSDIWSEFAKSPEDTTAVISTKASGHTDLSIRFPVSTGAFSGYVFSDFLLDMDIDISKRKLKKFDIRLNKQTGLSGTLRLKVASGFKLTLVEAEYNFKPFWIPNTPIVVRPKMYIEESFEAKGEIDMKSSLRFLSEDQIYSISFNGENTTFDSKKNPHNNNYLKFDYLNADAQMELSAVCGVKFAFLNDDLLAFGVESDAKQKLILHDDISMDDKGLLVQNPTIDVIPSITASLYCESVLLDVVDQVEDNRISYIYDFGLPSYTISTLPQFMNVNKNKSGGSLSVSADLVQESLLKSTEEGFALFEAGENTPIVHFSFGSGARTKGLISDEVKFTLPNPEKNYLARSYAVADGRYYYGPIKRLKSWKYDEDLSDDAYTWIDDLYYDEDGRIEKVVRTSNSGYTYDRAVFSYLSDDLIKVTGEEMTCDYHYFVDGKLVKTEIQDDFGGMSTYEYLYDSYGHLTEIILNSNLIYRFNWSLSNINSFCEYWGGSSSLTNIIYGEDVNTMENDFISLWMIGGSDAFYACLYLMQGPYTEKLPIKYEWEQLVREYNGRGEVVNEFVFNASETLTYTVDAEGYVSKIESLWKGYDAGLYMEDSNKVECEYESD